MEHRTCGKTIPEVRTRDCWYFGQCYVSTKPVHKPPDSSKTQNLRRSTVLRNKIESTAKIETHSMDLKLRAKHSGNKVNTSYQIGNSELWYSKTVLARIQFKLLNSARCENRIFRKWPSYLRTIHGPLTNTRVSRIRSWTQVCTDVTATLVAVRWKQVYSHSTPPPLRYPPHTNVETELLTQGRDEKRKAQC